MLRLFSTFGYPRRSGRPLVLAHRGASADAPENTLAAFREAVRQGADGVELDAMSCGSGEVVVCHDEWLDRLAGAHLEVAETPLGELKRLDVGRSCAPASPGACIPTLDEVLDALPDGFVVNVELKGATVGDRGLARRAARVMSGHARRLRLVVSSFNPLLLARARIFSPRLPAAILVGAAQRLAPRELLKVPLGLAAIHAHHAYCTAERVSGWHARGLAVAAWTVDEPADVERCRRAGMDVLITNRPAATLARLAGARAG